MSNTDLKDGMTILGLLERGALGPALTAEIEKVVKHLQEVAADRSKAKGSLNLKLDFTVEGDAVRLRTEFTSKLPKAARPESLFFLTKEGALSLEHPHQISMFPKEIAGRDTASA